MITQEELNEAEAELDMIMSDGATEEEVLDMILRNSTMRAVYDEQESQ